MGRRTARRVAEPRQAINEAEAQRGGGAGCPASKKRPMSPLIVHKPPARLHLGRRESAATAEALLRAVVSERVASPPPPTAGSSWNRTLAGARPAGAHRRRLSDA